MEDYYVGPYHGIGYSCAGGLPLNVHIYGYVDGGLHNKGSIFLAPGLVDLIAQLTEELIG